MIRWVSVAAALAAVTTALLCGRDACSNDTLGVLGDERLEWSASPGATYYQVARFTDTDVIPCAATNTTSLSLPGTDCYADRILVRACAPDTADPPGLDRCSEWNWSEPVEILPYACVRGYTHHTGPLPRDNWTETCETPCWLGAPRRLANIPECPP